MLLFWQPASEPPTTYRDLVTADGPVAYYRLGESAGTNADDLANNNDATYSGTPTFGVAGPSGMGGDTAVTLGATTKYVERTAATHLNFAGVVPFSFEFWFKPSVVDASTRSTVGRFDANNGYRIYHLTNEVAFERRAAGVVTYAASATSLTVGAWHHLVGTYDGTNQRLYRNGTLVGGPGASSGSIAGVDLPFGINAFDHIGLGDYDEVAVYDYALTQTQITAHYNKGVEAGGPPPAITGTVSVTQRQNTAEAAAEKFIASVTGLQRQSMAASAKEKFVASVAGSQRQSASVTGSEKFIASVAAAQTQTTAASGTVITPVTGTVAGSQRQSMAATAAEKFTGAVAVTQRQNTAESAAEKFLATVSGTQRQNMAATAVEKFTATVSGSQSQTMSASGSVAGGGPDPITGTVSGSQRQTASVGAAESFRATVSGSQRQSASATGQLKFTATVSASQAQSVAVSGVVATPITGTVATSQRQSMAAAGSGGAAAAAARKSISYGGGRSGYRVYR